MKQLPLDDSASLYGRGTRSAMELVSPSVAPAVVAFSASLSNMFASIAWLDGRKTAMARGNPTSLFPFP